MFEAENLRAIREKLDKQLQNYEEDLAYGDKWAHDPSPYDVPNKFDYNIVEKCFQELCNDGSSKALEIAFRFLDIFTKAIVSREWSFKGRYDTWDLLIPFGESALPGLSKIARNSCEYDCRFNATITVK